MENGEIRGCDQDETSKTLCVTGARVHNLKNINVSLPRNSLTVITGLSGSGKTSLAFDTIFAEGQRRYIATFSAYARGFLLNMERPDIDKITGLSPVISIDQKTTNKNPRSTVGTVTEIYDYLRLLYAKIGEAHSYVTGEKMVKYTEDQLFSKILSEFSGQRIYILSPLVRNRKGHYRELLESLRRKGFTKARIDGKLQELSDGLKLDRYKNHDIELVVDRLKISSDDEIRLKKSLNTALKQGDGLVEVLSLEDDIAKYFSKRLMCPTSGISYKEPAPHNFSFNSPTGSCPKCKGLGRINAFDMSKIIPSRDISIKDGGIIPLGKYHNTLIFWEIEAILLKYDCTLGTLLSKIPEAAFDEIFYGAEDRLRIPSARVQTSSDYYVHYEGLAKYLASIAEKETSATAKKWAEQFSVTKTCPVCHGARLNNESLHFFVSGKNIHELSCMNIKDLKNWMEALYPNLLGNQKTIAEDIIKEICKRLGFLLDVGLDYLSLGRPANTLSGGESQRIRLATQIGSQLVNVLYILDEPSIGLHQRDNLRLIHSLQKLRDLGNTIIVVEHDRDMMTHADYIIDMGPGAGRLGGEVVFQGTVNEMLLSDSLTSNYLKNNISIPVPKIRKRGNGKSLIISGARGNNLKNISITIPLGLWVCITGVSGSGKSTLINNTLSPYLSKRLYHSLQEPLDCDNIFGVENIDKLVNVDQTPLGRTPRSNPATYTGVFSDIRALFESLPEAKIRGYNSSRFSFNVRGGRCEACKGYGVKNIEMNFLPNVMVPCEVCRGNRYNRETLEVKYKGKSIADILNMTVNQSVSFFENIPVIYGKIKLLQDVGLGYIKLGQSSTTLSGGESQRIKLATELSKKDTSKTLYILDEPTTGLHFEDIRILSSVLERLVNRGNTVLVIEHNLDIIKQADYIIDMGPEGGNDGGTIVSEGTPEQIVHKGIGYTAQYLADVLNSAQ